MKKLLLLVSLSSVVFPVLFGQISGVKTVGDGGDYATLSNAVADVNTNGLNGDAVLEIKDGYDQDEFIGIQKYVGNDQFTLTIRPEPGATEVTLRGAGGSIIMLDSANHVVIDGRPGGVSDTCVLRLLHSNMGNSATCYVLDSKNTIIRNCCIRFDGTRAVELQTSDASLVENCDIASYTTGPSSNGGTYGIESYMSSNSVIRNNRIHDLHTESLISVYGINMYSADPVISNDSIYNNFITLIDYSADSSANVVGIAMYNDSAHYYVYFNTVYTGGQNIKGRDSFGLHCQGTKKLDLKNNIIINDRSNGIGTGNHYGIYLNYGLTDEQISSDFNDILCDGTGGIVGSSSDWGTTLADWQALTGWDLNSVSNDVAFEAMETGDLHLSGSSLTDTSLVGMNIPGIADIDNEMRPIGLNFMGADQPPAVEPCVPGNTSDPENIIENGDFENCTLSNWYLYANESAGVTASTRLVDGSCEISGITLSAEPVLWDIQFIQAFSPGQLSRLTEGFLYELSFDALAGSDDRPCRVAFQQNESPWSTLLDETISINTSSAHYSYEFTANTVYSTMSLTFQPGTDASPITLDNVRLVEKLTGSLPGNNPGGITIMPNPATNFILVKAANNSIVCLYNSMGNMVNKVIVEKNEVHIDVSGLAKGLYIVELKDGDDIHVEKLILQ
jgi:hypothetical protein